MLPRPTRMSSAHVPPSRASSLPVAWAQYRDPAGDRHRRPGVGREVPREARSFASRLPGGGQAVVDKERAVAKVSCRYTMSVRMLAQAPWRCCCCCPAPGEPSVLPSD
jgi:hypothetical protein